MTRREHEITDRNQITQILDKCKIVHLAFVDNGQPYLIPMNYCYTIKNGDLTLYVHAAADCYKLDVIRRNPSVSFEMECDIEPFEGRVACQYGVSYSAIFGRGTAEIVNDVPEKEHALSLLMKAQTGKDFTFNEKMVSIVSVIKIHVSEYIAKHRPIPEGILNL